MLKTVSVTIDPQMLSIFDEQSNGWQLPKGKYKITAGSSSEDTPLKGTIEVK